MQFNTNALHAKTKHLDEILQKKDLLNKVLSRNLHKPFEIHAMNRVWEPGGGSTLFRIETPKEKIFLKVKHKSVTVESMLESESSPIDTPSLRNEYDFFRSINAEWVPRVVFFDEQEGFEFLAMEWLETFSETIKRFDIAKLLEAWAQIDSYAKKLFDRNIVHTDIHEHNIGFRSDQPVLLDFEEARYLKQELPFSESLDAIGKNRYGNVGDFPKGNGLPGYTCLARLRKVFAKEIMGQLPDLLKRCAFGQECPYNLDEFQAPDSRIYQSVNFGNVTIAGQRPVSDKRLKLLRIMLKRLMPDKKPFSYEDIGSNLGTFCVEAAASPRVKRIVGIEADQEYVTASRAIAFLKNLDQIEFHRAICGEDPLHKIIGNVDIVTMFSVYHHVRNKDRFIDDLKKTGVKYLIAEFATQDRYYPERGDLEKEMAHIKKEIGFNHLRIISKSKDYNRPIVIFSNEEISGYTVLLCKLALLEKKMLVAQLRRVKAHLGRMVRKTRSDLKFLREKASAKMRSEKKVSFRFGEAWRWLKAREILGEGIGTSDRTNQSYPEVTGYIIPSILDWGERDMSIRLAEWLISIQNPDGSWNASDNKIAYTFDTGQILKGLISLVDEKPQYKEAIIKGCDWIMTKQRTDGSIETPDDSAWGLPGGKCVPEAIHLYALQPILAASKKWNIPKYEECVKKALGFYLAQPDLTDFNTLSHFHAYIIEGLIDLGQTDRAKKAMAEIEKYQNKNGSVPAYPDVRWICSTGLFQYAVCWYKLNDLQKGNKVFAYACKLQNKSGGWYGSYGKKAEYFPNEEISWSVKYFLDALHLKIRCEFNSSAHIFPAHIKESDGRYALIEEELQKNNGKKVIDIGCGKGRFISKLKERNPHIEACAVALILTLILTPPLASDRVHP